MKDYRVLFYHEGKNLSYEFSAENNKTATEHTKTKLNFLKEKDKNSMIIYLLRIVVKEETEVIEVTKASSKKKKG